jgi:lysyl-tRNA synthetase class I
MIDFAQKNGFNLQIDKDSNEDGYDTETREILRKRDEIRKKINEERDRKLRETFVSPPLEILARKYTNDEPVRSGFN